MRLQVVRGDITTLGVDAIVNAAHPSLLGGSGVDGAIHRAAGPKLLAECRALPEVEPGVRCPVGEARITRGYGLLARWVIHVVGPVWHGGVEGEPDLLHACYDHALELAAQHKLRSIAFPAISCGAYGYPADAAARLAVDTLHAWPDGTPDRAVLCAFDSAMDQRYRALLHS